MTSIKPFQNESDTASIGDLTVENRLDRLSLYGSLAITKDKAGLHRALELKHLLDAAIAVLQSNDLPDEIVLAPTDTIPNPFDKS